MQITRLGFVNAYLVTEDDGLTLVDTLITGGHKPILRAARDHGLPIVRIALTHAHMDHVGGLDKLVEALPDAEVLISSREARLLAGDASLDPEEPQTKIKGGVPKKVAARPTRTIEPGERIGSLEVIAAPGHTPGQVAFLDTRDRTLYCGDAYTTLGGVATTAKPNPRFPLPALVTWHRPTALETARALRALNPAALAPGHGKVVDEPGRRDGPGDRKSRLAAGQHDVVAVGAQHLDDDVAVVALELDHAVLGRAADAAALLQAAGQLAQAGVVERDAGHGGDRLAAPAGDLAADLHAPAGLATRLQAGVPGLAQVAVGGGVDEARGERFATSEQLQHALGRPGEHGPVAALDDRPLEQHRVGGHRGDDLVVGRVARQQLLRAGLLLAQDGARAHARLAQQLADLGLRQRIDVVVDAVEVDAALGRGCGRAACSSSTSSSRRR